MTIFFNLFIKSNKDLCIASSGYSCFEVLSFVLLAFMLYLQMVASEDIGRQILAFGERYVQIIAILLVA